MKMKKQEKLICRIIDGETLILNPESNAIFSLNKTGTVVWGLLDEFCEVDKIINKVVREYNVSYENAKKDIDELIKSLLQQSLIIKDPA